MTQTRVSAVVLAYGAEPFLEPCVRSLLASTGVDVEVVLVDNGCSDGTVDRLAGEQIDGLVVVRPGENLGYAEGCNEGARHATGQVLAFVNYDATVRPETLRRLADVASRPDVGIATGSIRLADEPALLNSAGNDIHFLGLSWSGRFRVPAALHAEEQEVTGASGAGMALTCARWEQLGGFDPTFFMYHDDAELSLRCLLAGLRIVYVPDAVVVHRYEFTRNPRKLYLIERNRLIMLLTSFEARTLLLILPPLLVVEASTLALAVREGWWRAKLRAWWWLATHARYLRDRRSRIQGQRRVSDRAVVGRFVARIEPGNYELSPLVGVLNRGLELYWGRVVGLV